MNKLTISCLVAAIGIGLGAFGAHGLKDVLQAGDHVKTWDTATHYHLIHALALFVAATQAHRLKVNLAYWLWFIGIVLFSGSLYGLSLAGWKWLGPITPLGGLSFMAGWLALALQNLKAKS